MTINIKQGLLFLGLTTGLLWCSSAIDAIAPSEPTFFLSDDMGVAEIYAKAGQISDNALNPEIKGVDPKKGRDIIFTGRSAKQNGKGTTAIQSPYFKCTACHNNVKEFPSLTDLSAKDRLAYAEKNDLPFLQGSTFHGIVNRETFYNDDYQKKYGHVPIIKASNTDIRTAIQLCATQCAQGRELEDWEIESVLAYYWSLEITVKDLNLSAEEKSTIETAIQNKENLAEVIQILDGKYLDKSPAHFKDHKAYDENTTKGMGKENFAQGKLVYERSCLHCHEGRRYSFFALDDSRLSFMNLLNRTKSNSFGGLHEITRHGTWPLAGKKAYMPLYPEEKLSESQLHDLLFYVEQRAAGKESM